MQSVQILHKSDAGVLRLGLADESSVRSAYQAVMNTARQYPRDTHSDSDEAIDGVLVQAMAPAGVEMIIGINRDPDFGLMMLVGADGILMELMKDSVNSPRVACSMAYAVRLRQTLMHWWH
jgi:acyl-CoA synthetase (NDP forming)